MRIWPRSLRMRLILVLTLAMVATQVIVFFAVAEFFGREQRTERAMQMARLITFVKPRVEAMTDVVLDQPLALRRRRPPAVDEAGRDDRAPRPLSGPEAPRGPGEPGTRMPPLEPGARPPPGEDAKFRGPRDFPRTSRDLTSITVTATLPDGEGDADIVSAMRTAVPEVVAATYRESTDWFKRGPNRPYAIEVWTQLGPNRYLKTVFDETRITAERHGDERSAFATLDLLLRAGVGVVLALVIMGWISKPLSRLADSADATLPNGELRPGAARFDPHDAPTEISHTLAAFDRMRVRIGAMVAERTTMLTALAHDLRTPITRLMLRLELSQDEKLRADAYRDCEKMQHLISRTLDFIRSSEQGASLGVVRLDHVMAQVLSALPAEDAQRCTLDMPADGVAVYASEWGIERAIANVLGNALKYSPKDTPVGIIVKPTDHHVSIRVLDSGPGVPADMISKLREPFFRVDAARNMDDGGAGLGLSIVDNLVRLYGGDVMIENRAEGGLAVTITLAVAGPVLQTQRAEHTA